MISNPLAPNPTQLMAKLRMMPDQELFQYAQMHQSDPYIFPLTFQESNARKAARSAQQMQPGQPPKVVQQDLQQMAPQQAPRMGGAAMPAQMAQGAPQQPQQALPEDQGIGQLPAQNMQGMAEGGIVGYAPGGQVDPKQSFAAKYRDAAFAAGQTLGVDPGIILSQWGIETRWGQSKKPMQANNLGNIKAGASWDGPTVTQHDKVEGSNSKYRSYDSTDAFVKDYVDLIKTKYPEAIGAGSDAAKFANGLRPGKQGGYATDKNYTNTLVSTAKALSPLVPVASAQAGQAPRKDLGLSPNETVVQPAAQARVPVVDSSIPTNYKQAQASQQADYDAQVKALQNESFLDKSKRIGRGLVGMGEVGLSTLGGVTTYPTAAIAAAAQNPKGAKDAAQGLSTPEAAAYYKAMDDLRNQATYAPRTPEGQEQLETFNRAVSGLPPYMGTMVGAKPTQLRTTAAPEAVTKPGLPALVESPAAKAVEPAIPDAVKAAREKQAAARANVQTQVGEPKPAPSAPLSAVEAARAKQAKAKEGLQALLPDTTTAPVTFPITPESLAAREAAAAKLKAAQPAPAPVEGQTFPIEPDNAGIAAAQRARLELEKQADEARNAAPPTEEAPVKPVEEMPSAMTPEEMVDRARNYEMDRQKESIIRNRQTATEAGLPGLVNPTNPSAPVSAAPDYTPPLMPNAMTMESAESNPTEETPPEDTTAPSTAEAPKKGGMDYNDLMIKMGLGMMAGKSPHALVNVGEAGLGALQMTSAEKKAAAEQAYHEALAEQARAHAAYYPGLLAQKMAGLDSKQRIAVETETARLMAPYRNNPMYYGNLAAMQQMESNVREGVMNRILGQNQPAAGAAPVTVPQDVTVKQIR